ncbi:MAG: hypothetical protein AB7V39_25510 [Nitrospiraceae bacterium]
MKNENITAWVTKYALTSGIQKVGGTVRQTNSNMLVYQAKTSSVMHYSHAWGNEWHRTPEAALARAEEMRKNKIASLKKSLAKLEAMMFMIEE